MLCSMLKLQPALSMELLEDKSLRSEHEPGTIVCGGGVGEASQVMVNDLRCMIALLFSVIFTISPAWKLNVFVLVAGPFGEFAAAVSMSTSLR